MIIRAQCRLLWANRIFDDLKLTRNEEIPYPYGIKCADRLYR